MSIFNISRPSTLLVLSVIEYRLEEAVCSCVDDGELIAGLLSPEMPRCWDGIGHGGEHGELVRRECDANNNAFTLRLMMKCNIKTVP